MRSKYHPEESFVGESRVLFDCGQYTKDKTYQHHHKPTATDIN